MIATGEGAVRTLCNQHRLPELLAQSLAKVFIGGCMHIKEGRVPLLEEKAETSAGVSVGDLNGDGLPDIVLGKGRHWPLFNRVLLNDGHGGFIASNLGTAPDRTYSAALADIDGDGHLDIVVSNDVPDRKLVYRLKESLPCRDCFACCRLEQPSA